MRPRVITRTMSTTVDDSDGDSPRKIREMPKHPRTFKASGAPRAYKAAAAVRRPSKQMETMLGTAEEEDESVTSFETQPVSRSSTRRRNNQRRRREREREREIGRAHV